MSVVAQLAGAVSPVNFTSVPVSPERKASLFVVVDTEEEFDWSAPFSRDNIDTSAIAEVGRLQDVLEPYGLRPTYVIDYPVATTSSSADRLASLAKDGRCEIGAHLHPWVSPPYTDSVDRRSSYACNLGFDLECEKISRLKTAIREHLGIDARSYKAGRYGFGETTARALEALNFDIDLSVNPHMDFTPDGGPSFEGFEPTPLTFGRTRKLLELPCTTGFIGAARRAGAPLHRAASAPWLETFRAVGVLSKTGLVNKVMLSPEGNTLQEMRQLTDSLYRDGVRIFALTLHSPSLKPGCTPYVRTTAERDAFLKTIDEYCRYFMNGLGGVPTTPARIFDELRLSNFDVGS